MRVLAHIHTFNDADIIDGTIEAVRQQTRPVDGILVVDNASTDGTLARPSLRHAASCVIRKIAERAAQCSAAFALRSSIDTIGSGYSMLTACPIRTPCRSCSTCTPDGTASCRKKPAFLACLPLAQDGTPTSRRLVHALWAGPAGADARPSRIIAAIRRSGPAVCTGWRRSGESVFPTPITCWIGAKTNSNTGS